MSFSHYGHYLVSALAAERSRGTPGRWDMVIIADDLEKIL